MARSSGCYRIATRLFLTGYKPIRLGSRWRLTPSRPSFSAGLASLDVGLARQRSSAARAPARAEGTCSNPVGCAIFLFGFGLCHRCLLSMMRLTGQSGAAPQGASINESGVDISSRKARIGSVAEHTRYAAERSAMRLAFASRIWMTVCPWECLPPTWRNASPTSLSG